MYEKMDVCDYRMMGWEDQLVNGYMDWLRNKLLMDGWKVGWVGRWMDGWMDGRLGGSVDGWMDGWISKQMKKGMDQWIYGINESLGWISKTGKLFIEEIRNK